MFRHFKNHYFMEGDATQNWQLNTNLNQGTQSVTVVNIRSLVLSFFVYYFLPHFCDPTHAWFWVLVNAASVQQNIPQSVTCVIWGNLRPINTVEKSLALPGQRWLSCDNGEISLWWTNQEILIFTILCTGASDGLGFFRRIFIQGTRISL